MMEYKRYIDSHRGLDPDCDVCQKFTQAAIERFGENYTYIQDDESKMIDELYYSEEFTDHQEDMLEDNYWLEYWFENWIRAVSGKLQ